MPLRADSGERRPVPAASPGDASLLALAEELQPQEQLQGSHASWDVII